MSPELEVSRKVFSPLEMILPRFFTFFPCRLKIFAFSRLTPIRAAKTDTEDIPGKRLSFAFSLPSETAFDSSL